MSEQNVENLRAWIESWDLEAWASSEWDTSLLDAEIAYEDTILPDHVGETYRGYEGIVRATTRWIEPFEDVTVDVEEILGTGEHLVSTVRGRGRARQTGIEFDMRYAYHWTFRDGVIIHGKSFLDPATALRAAAKHEREEWALGDPTARAGSPRSVPRWNYRVSIKCRCTSSERCRCLER